VKAAALAVLSLTSALSAASIDERLAAARNHFDRERSADTWWYYGWLGFSGSVLATSTTLYLAADEGSQLQKAQPVSMAISGAGVLSLVILRPRSFAAADELAKMPENTDAEKQAKLKRSEEWLAAAAARQSFTTGAIAQVGTISFLGLASLADAIWLNGPAFATLRFVVSLAFAEFKIFTQPVLSRDLYDRRKKDEPLQWTIRMAPGEVAVVAVF